MRHFCEIDFFFENVKWQSILHVFMKSLYFYIQKVNIFVKFKETKFMLYVHMNFAGLPKNLYVPHTTFLGFSARISGAFFGQNKFLANLKRQTFLHLFMKRLY